MQANIKDKYIPKTGELVHIAENMQWKPFRLDGFITSGFTDLTAFSKE